MMGVTMAVSQHSDNLEVGPLRLTPAVTVQATMKKVWRS